ncbi:HAD hydrolase-like protein [Alkalicaulis satelles]|uniref:HAD hydrolase-like protein n=1 Tax=Alkalicaulis satelles TaxID=2609175 RepID=UPI001E41E530|nr:HAD hydrolase-like protein [Alkalicaulis satelles]
MSLYPALSGARLAFDLDGTLVDTAPDLVRALNASITPFGLDPVPLDDVRAMVGRGARALIERAFERAGRPHPPEQELTDALELFLAVYRDGIADLSRPFPGVEEALETLAGAGARLSVCTNKPGWLAVPLLEALAMAGRFERITGAEDAPAKKPDPAHFFTAVGGGPAGAGDILVGDSSVDYDTARAAGAGIVLFELGYNEKPVSTLGADRLFDAYGSLPALLDGLVTARQALRRS